MRLIKKYAPAAIAGALSGFVNGFLGAGGGVIATFFLSGALKEKEKGGDKNAIFANAVATMLPISAVSLATYYFCGSITLDLSMLSLVPCALIGGALGAYLLTRVKFKTIKTAFALLVSLSGLMMIFK